VKEQRDVLLLRTAGASFGVWDNRGMCSCYAQLGQVLVCEKNKGMCCCCAQLGQVLGGGITEGCAAAAHSWGKFRGLGRQRDVLQLRTAGKRLTCCCAAHANTGQPALKA